MSDQKTRLAQANQLLETIKTTGCCLFANKHGFEAKLVMGGGNRICFIDDYSGKKILIGEDRITTPHFSHGGTLNDFIVLLVRFVRIGSTMNVNYLGQHWGYGDDIAIVRKKANEIGFAV